MWTAASLSHYWPMKRTHASIVMSLTSAQPDELIWKGITALLTKFTLCSPSPSLSFVFVSQCFPSCPRMACSAPRAQHLPFRFAVCELLQRLRQHRGRHLIINGDDSQSDVSFGELWRGRAYGPRRWQVPSYYCCTLWSSGSVAQLTAVLFTFHFSLFEWNLGDTGTSWSQFWKSMMHCV